MSKTSQFNPPLANRRQILRSTAALAGAIALLGANVVPVNAQAKYPEGPIRVVVPFGAGGVGDVTARIVGEKLGAVLGQRIVIENQPAAGGISAAQNVLRSPADGYTLSLFSNGTAVSVGLFKKLPFDPLT